MKTKHFFYALLMSTAFIWTGCSKEQQDEIQQKKQAPSKGDIEQALNKLPERGHSRSCIIPAGVTKTINNEMKSIDGYIDLVYVPENYYPIREPQDPWFDPYIRGTIRSLMCASPMNKLAIDWWTYNYTTQQWTQLIDNKLYDCLREGPSHTKNVVMKEGVQFEERHWALMECDIFEWNSTADTYIYIGTLSSNWVWTGE